MTKKEKQDKAREKLKSFITPNATVLATRRNLQDMVWCDCGDSIEKDDEAMCGNCVYVLRCENEYLRQQLEKIKKLLK